jgi:predicted ATPase
LVLAICRALPFAPEGEPAVFQSITIKNFRTHIDSTMHLGRVTLLLGNNNSGKTNLLSGIRHFSQLIGRANPDKEEPRQLVEERDFFPHRHRLSDRQAPLVFACTWTESGGSVEYRIELSENRALPRQVAVKERIGIAIASNAMQPVGFDTGGEGMLDSIILRQSILDARDPVTEAHKQLAQRFFRDLAQAFAYHLQPSYLKGLVPVKWPRVDPVNLVVPSQLGHEGGNLIEIIKCYPKADENAFNRFIASLRRFYDKFHTVRLGKDDFLIWEFDLGPNEPGRLDSFDTTVVSDGLLKAAAISLLTTVRHPPALILLEEIENGVNPSNIHEFMSWIQQATVDSRYPTEWRTQFILTTHSPAVLREFHDQLENVYSVKLHTKGFRSDVRNLAQALDTLIGLGALDGEIVEENGQRKVLVTQKDLVDLWHSGTIG